jgi:hypothetical protein
MEMFDHALWREMRARYAADGAFPTIYEKVKPEMDPLQFLEEEQSWAETAGDGANLNVVAGCTDTVIIVQ